MDQKIKTPLQLQNGCEYVRLYINYRGQVNATLYKATSEVYLTKNALNEEKCVIDLASLYGASNSSFSYYLEDLGIGSEDEGELAYSSTGLYEYTDTVCSYIDGLLNNRMAVYEFLENKACTKEQKIQLYLKWLVATMDDLNNWIFSEGKDRLACHYKALATEVNQFL